MNLDRLSVEEDGLSGTTLRGAGEVLDGEAGQTTASIDAYVECEAN